MIRPVFTEIALFLAPFIAYAIFLWATKAGVLHPDSWTLPRIAWLVIAALALMIGSFIVLAQWGGGALMAFLVMIVIRIWFFLEIQTNRVLREVKRVELQLARLSAK